MFIAQATLMELMNIKNSSLMYDSHYLVQKAGTNDILHTGCPNNSNRVLN